MIASTFQSAALTLRARSYVCLLEASEVLQSVTSPMARWSVAPHGLAAQLLYPGVLEVFDPVDGRTVARSEAGELLRPEANTLPSAAPSMEARFWRDEARREATLRLACAVQASRLKDGARLYRQSSKLASVGDCELLFLWPGVIAVEVVGLPRSGVRVVACSAPGRPDELDPAFATLVHGR